MRSGKPRNLSALAVSLLLIAAALACGSRPRRVARTSSHVAADRDPDPVRPTALTGGDTPSSRSGFRTLVLVGLIAGAAAIAGGGGWFGHVQRITREAAAATGGDPDRAVPIMLANGCAGCHTIPGVPGAHALVGPRLDGTLAQRVYIAGVLPNTPANLIRWLRVSREVDPLTVMPSTHIPEQDARDVAAYLYALR